MAEINKVIEAILRDVLEARASVDIISRDLVSQYAGDDVLKYFNIPKVNLGSMEFELKYAVDSVESVPLNSSETIRKKNALIENFSKRASKNLQNSFSKLTNSNPLYQSLGSDFPNEGWRKNIEQLISKEVSSMVLDEKDNSDALIKKSQASIIEQIDQVVPKAKQMEGLYVIPNKSGNFEIISLSEKKEIDLKVGKEFKDSDEAINISNLLLGALKSDNAVVEKVERDPLKKIDKVEIVFGNQKLPIESKKFMESTKPDPKNFTGFLKEKEKPVSFKLVPPWLTGNIPDKKSPSVATTAVANVKPIDDLAFKNNAADLFGKEFQSLKSDLEKLKTETSKPLINVELETLKLKEIDPSRLLTVRFTLDMRDFSITDDEQPSIVN